MATRIKDSGERKQPAQPPWVLVCGGFHKHGGMDKANWHLAHFLLESGRRVHLVGHVIDECLVRHPLAHIERAPRPLGSYFLGSPLLERRAASVWRRVQRQWPGARLIANGSNYYSPDVNWSHFVNAAWEPRLEDAPLLERWRHQMEHRRACRRERGAYRAARLIVCNSERTRRDVLACAGGGIQAARTIYLGSDAGFRAVTASERAAARQPLGIAAGRRIAAFVGGLGFNNRKGFDVLYRAWRRLCEDPGWDADLLVAGDGPAWASWRQTILQGGLGERIRLLGFSKDVPGILAAADLLVSVPKYEPYGLNVQEALGRGVPTVVSREAGIAERFPASLSRLLVADPGSVADCVGALRFWRENEAAVRAECQGLGHALCARSWDAMAREMVDCIEGAADQTRAAAPEGSLAGAGSHRT